MHRFLVPLIFLSYSTVALAQQQALRFQTYSTPEAASADFQNGHTALIAGAYVSSGTPSWPWEALTFVQVFAPDDSDSCDHELGSSSMPSYSCSPLAGSIVPKVMVFSGTGAEAAAKAFYDSTAIGRRKDAILIRKTSTLYWVLYATCQDFVLECPCTPANLPPN